MKFTHSTGDKEYETILTAEEAARFTVANIFGTWTPDAICAQQTTTATISDDKHTLTWDDNTRVKNLSRQHQRRNAFHHTGHKPHHRRRDNISDSACG